MNLLHSYQEQHHLISRESLDKHSSKLVGHLSLMSNFQKRTTGQIVNTTKPSARVFVMWNLINKSIFLTMVIAVVLHVKVLNMILDIGLQDYIDPTMVPVTISIKNITLGGVMKVMFQKFIFLFSGVLVISRLR